MRSLILAVALAMSVYGCAFTEGLTKPLHTQEAPAEETAAQRSVRLAHEAIDEANAALTSVNGVILDNAVSGVWTKTQAQDALNISKTYGADVDKARESLRLGEAVVAKDTAELITQAILSFHKEIAAQARKEGN